MELSFWITNAFGRFYQKTARILPSSISGRGSICSGGDAMSMERFLNKVIHGDCLEVMKDIPEKSVDMILCDLPYG
jgi:hypothetical protein